MKSLPKTRTRAFHSGGLGAAVLLMAAAFLVASGGIAGAESLNAKNQMASRSIHVWAFKGDGSCAPQDAGVAPQTESTLGMDCTIGEVCVVINDTSANYLGLVDISTASVATRSCNLKVGGSPLSGDTNPASDGHPCTFHWKIKGSPGTKVLTCTES